MKGVLWILLSVFLKQSFAFIQEHDSLTYTLWKPKLLIYTFMHSISCISLQQGTSLQFFSSSRSCTFVSSWFIKPSSSLMSDPASSTCHNNSILSSIWRSSSNSTFSAAFLSFSTVWLIFPKVVWQPSFMQSPFFFALYFVGIQLASSCTSQLYCSFCWRYL